MAVRPIDAYRLQEELKQIANGMGRISIHISDMAKVMERCVNRQPTLTPPNEWVSVEKRLPEDDAPAGRKQITVMVTTKAGKVTIASRVFEPERDYCGKVYPARWLWNRWLNNYVTHWMVLPAPPGKDNNVPTKAQNEPLTLDSRLSPKMVTCPKGWQGSRDTRFYCPGCKKAVKKGEAYCHKCGQALMFPVQRYDKENNRIWLDFSDRRLPEGDENT